MVGTEHERVIKAMDRGLPSGTVTFLFTDVEGSTQLLHEIGAERYAEALAEHRRVLREAFAANSGVEVDTQGDAFFIAFSSAPSALAAAEAASKALAKGPIRVRMALHTGDPHVTGDGYVGKDVHLGARIAGAGHGGQVLLSQTTRELVDGKLTDLGEHRLKDFAEPVSIFQLGSQRFPPLKTISNTNLPRPASSFVGREQETAEVTSLLQDGARLLTLSGPGGSGKTRLAIEAASELVPEFKAGVFWVPLSPLRDPALVTDTIGQTLGAKDGLAEHIGEREFLLLLDNFEQVVEAAPELASLLESCPNLKLLVTSRELLRVRGEVEYAVPPLTEPEAVELFSTRSGLDRDDAIAELCRRLDNLPLAVELAAARTSVLSPAQILERLSKRLDLLKGGRDAGARQQTLRATIEWSYDLLNQEEQRLFARLAVFRGGCTLESAEAVCEADLDTLQPLVDKSLLRHSNERFWMLETIREYALERLEAAGEADELGRRHAEYFVAVGEEAWPHVREASGEWLDRLEREIDNLRATFDWLEASGGSHPALALAGATAEFWDWRGHMAEGRERLERLLRADRRHTRVRARALAAGAILATDLMDRDAARRWADEAVALQRQLGDAWGTAYALFALGMASVYDDWEQARERFAEAAELFRELGDAWQAGEVANRLAWAFLNLGEADRAREIHEGNLELARATGNRYTEAKTLMLLAIWSTMVERRAPADDEVAMLKQAVAIHQEIGALWGRVLDLGGFASILIWKGDAEAAARLLSCVESVQEEIGFSDPWFTDFNEQTLASIHAQLDEGAFAEAWERGRTLTLDDAVVLALAEVDRDA